MSGAGPDPIKPVLNLVGVYPVVNGFAQLNLQDVRGKAQTADQALHVFPGDSLLQSPSPTGRAGQACSPWRPRVDRAACLHPTGLQVW